MDRSDFDSPVVTITVAGRDMLFLGGPWDGRWRFVAAEVNHLPVLGWRAGSPGCLYVRPSPNALAMFAESLP